MSDLARPDPACDLVGSLRWIMDHVEALEQEKAERRVGASEAARQLGYGDSYFRGRPWRVPGFGLQGTMHSVAVWKAWIARPEVDRRAEWDAMSLKDRRRAQGVA